MGEKVLRLSLSWVIDSLKGLNRRRVVVESGVLPDDAEVVRVGYDEFANLMVVLKSSAWGDAPSEEWRRPAFCDDPVVRVIYDNESA